MSGNNSNHLVDAVNTLRGKRKWLAWLGTPVNGGCAAHTHGDLGTGFGIAQNRLDTGPLTTRRKMTFPAGSGPTKINVRLEDATAGLKAYVVLNAISDSHADNELADPASRDSSTERYTVIETSIQPQGLEISSVTPISRLDYLLDAAGTAPELIVEGA